MQKFGSLGTLFLKSCVKAYSTFHRELHQQWSHWSARTGVYKFTNY